MHYLSPSRLPGMLIWGSGFQCTWRQWNLKSYSWSLKKTKTNNQNLTLCPGCPKVLLAMTWRKTKLIEGVKRVCVCVSGCFLQKIWQTSVMPSGQMFGLCNNLFVIMSCNEERGKRRTLGENVLVQPPIHHWKREECLCGAPNLIWIVTNPVCHHKIPLQIPQSLGNSSMCRYLNQGI